MWLYISINVDMKQSAIIYCQGRELSYFISSLDSSRFVKIR